MGIVSMTVGAVTDSAARVAVKVANPGDVRLVVATTPQLTDPVFFGPVTPNAQGDAILAASGLPSDITHWYGVEHCGTVHNLGGRFTTDPPVGQPASFEIVLAGDAGSTPEYPGVGAVLAPNRLSNHPVYDTIRERNPRRFVYVGDETYYDLGSDKHGIIGGGSLANYRRMFDDILLQPRQHQLLREIPSVRIPGDHCRGPNDHDRTYPGGVNYEAAYREKIPSYPLPDPNAVYQSWQIGRVLFVALDDRSYRDPNSDPQSPSKTMLGTAQKAWLNTLLQSSTAAYLVLVMSSQWTLSAHGDAWDSFQDERAELVQMFTDTGWLHRMCAVYGDRHAAGVDGGSGNPDGGFPLMMAAALDATPSEPPREGFDTGPDIPGRGQYGTVRVDDTGNLITVELSVWRGTARLRSAVAQIPTGQVSMATAAGKISVTPDTAVTAPWGGTTYQGVGHVDLTGWGFTGTPTIEVSVHTSVVAKRNVLVSLNNPTPTGFDVLVARTTAGVSTNVHWTATELT